MKVKCTGYKQDREKYFTIGKIYEVSSSGAITNDRGFVYDFHGKKTLDWLKGWYDFEPIANTYELHITCNDGKTTNAVYKVNGKIEKRTEAVCAPSDTFDFVLGAQTAFDRVFPKPIAPHEDKPKFKVGQKVKFTNTKTGFKSYLIGKTFEIANLQGALDDGFRYGIGETFIALESELEPYTEPEQPMRAPRIANAPCVPTPWKSNSCDNFISKQSSLIVTRDMLEKLGACRGGIETFDRLFPSGKSDYKTVISAAQTDDICVGCCYDDWFEGRKSQIEAMQNEQPKEPIVLYCIKDYINGSGDQWLKKGKTYDVVHKGKYDYLIYETWESMFGNFDFEKYCKNNPATANCLIKTEKRPAKSEEYIIPQKDCASFYRKNEVYCVKKVSSNGCRLDNGSFISHGNYLVLDGYTTEPEKELEPVYYNGEVIYTGIDESGEIWTEGKKYTFVDGNVICDNGKTYYHKRTPTKTLEEANKRIIQSGKFIPYLGE